MTLKNDISLSSLQADLLKPKITIFGVGGAGGNAINNMIRSNLEGVEFVAANTDAQSLSNSLAKNKIQLGLKTTRGLGAGSFPDRGRASAEENIEEIEQFLNGANMVFIAAGMGGGTGTGAAPVIAKLARERDILTVGVVTKPFHFEGKYRMETADSGIDELKKYVDTLIIIPNQNLFRIANEHTTFESAFKMADDVLHAGVRGITDLITMPGLVNLDFADIRTIMTKMGKAMMGTGEATGDNRALDACEAAISNPLLDNISIKGAKGVLVNMTGGPDMTLFEADIAVNAIKKEVDPNANIIFGSAFNENMKGKIRISVVATGIDIEEFKREIKNDYGRDNLKAERHLEQNEASRFKINLDGKEKNSEKNYFDPGFVQSNSGDEIEEINQDNFSTKKSYIAQENNEFEDNLDNNKNNVTQKPINLSNKSINFFENDDFYDESIADDDEQGEENIEPIAKEAEQKKKSPDSKSSKVKLKKESGFNLFGFMNSNKAKITDLDDEDEDIIETNIAKHSKSKAHNHLGETNYDKSKSKSNAEMKRKQFFGETIFDDNVNNSGDNFEDDIVNVPAFLRRKK
jgi:cell division protein FtsZ